MGMIRLTRQYFNRTLLSGLGLKISSRRSNMELPQDWSVAQFDKFITDSFPPIFAWVKANLPAGHRGLLWILLIQKGQELHQSVCCEVDLTMEYIWDIVYKPGKGAPQSELFVGTAIPVPEKVVRQLLGRADPTRRLVIEPKSSRNKDDDDSEEDSESGVDDQGNDDVGSSGPGASNTANKDRGSPELDMPITPKPTSLKRKHPAVKSISEQTAKVPSKQAKVTWTGSAVKVKQEPTTPEPTAHTTKKAKHAKDHMDPTDRSFGDIHPVSPTGSIVTPTHPSNLIDLVSPSPISTTKAFFIKNPWVSSADCVEEELDF
ncbi:hypothetical protein FRC09_003210 [Ceratobasidium sp. 395]|nr:hypothetical protein FRC09_003210 [Ceratobasidium sp. 395]